MTHSQAAPAVPVHPGAVLRAEFLEPLGISQSRLAAETGLSVRGINEIVHGRRSVTAETAVVLAAYFGVSPESWVILQALYDVARARTAMEAKLARVRPLVTAGP